jgi:multidrug efflux system membrane fusion protein
MKLFWPLASVLLLNACIQAAENAPEEVRPVRVVRIGVAESARRIEYAGEVRARRETRLAFRVGGKIVERLVDVGAEVKAGQPVARLDAADLNLALASAKAQSASVESERNLAEAEYKRYRDLREKNFISQAEYDRRVSAFSTAESKLEAARAQERQAANQMAYAVLFADTAGIITGIEAEAGQVVAAGQTVARLARPGEKEVAFAVPESQREFLEKTNQFQVTLNARPGKSWKARLRELSPAADPATRTYAARATILEPGGDVELGMSAKIELTFENKTRAILVPIAAIHSRDSSPQVFLVQTEGKNAGTVRPQAVKTGGIVGESVVIESGLNPGDVVVAAGANLLRAGQKVKILNER